LGGQEHGSGGEHDGWVIENPTVIESDEVVDRLGHERVPLFREHEVIGNANGYGLGEDNWEDEERVEGAEASDVQIDVHAAVVVKNEISNGVGSLDRVGVSVEGVQEPGIVLSNEISRTRVCPEHVLAENNTFSIGQAGEKGKQASSLVGHHFSAVVRNTLPARREGLCFPGLVQYARDTFDFPVLGGIPS